MSDQLLFSRLDNTLWICDSTTPQLVVFVGEGSTVGTQTNFYNGDLWWINSQNDTLVKSGNIVGSLNWYDGHIWDAQAIHGFAISPSGIGWLASSDNGNGAFLVQVDLLNGSIIPIGPLGENPGIVDGLVVIPEPTSLILCLLALTLFTVFRKSHK